VYFAIENQEHELKLANSNYHDLLSIYKPLLARQKQIKNEILNIKTKPPLKITEECELLDKNIQEKMKKLNYLIDKIKLHTSNVSKLTVYLIKYKLFLT
jgi:hypothetical protein